MIPILTGSLIISFLHTFLPSHWLPIVTIGKKEGWSLPYTLRISFLAGLTHAVSTVLLGYLLSRVGKSLTTQIDSLAHNLAPVLLILLGGLYIYQQRIQTRRNQHADGQLGSLGGQDQNRHTHKHFHIPIPTNLINRKTILLLLVIMFFSPCIEVEGYFLLAGAYGNGFVLLIALFYTLVSIGGMLAWIGFAYLGVSRIRWHKIEHSAEMVTGITLIATGLLSFYLH
jgi:putative Mn2+ efflux pump MntP